MICTLQRYKISFNVQKLSLFWCPLTSFALVTALGKLSFLKQKLSQSKLIQLQIAMSIFYDLIMQCLHCLCNVHGRITLSICQAVVSCRPSQLTAKRWFRYSGFVTDFLAVISSQSEDLGKMALGIVKVYLGSPFSANRRCPWSVGSRSVCCGQLSWTLSCNRPAGRMVTRLSLEWEVWGSNLGLVKLDTVLPMACHCCYISSKEAVLPWHNDAEMGPANSLHALA